MIENEEKQAEIESRLLRIWAQGVDETAKIEAVFGPHENWLLTLGDHLFLLLPTNKQWYYLDRIHDTWESTGFGPQEVVFVTRGTQVGYRKKISLSKGAREISPDEKLAKTQLAFPSSSACPSCGGQAEPHHNYCPQCGTDLGGISDHG